MHCSETHSAMILTLTAQRARAQPDGGRETYVHMVPDIRTVHHVVNDHMHGKF